MTFLTGDKLRDRAKELGVDVQGERIVQSSSGRREFADDHELQRRVIEAERSMRESRIWLLAVISATASVLSAFAAMISAWK